MIEETRGCRVNVTDTTIERRRILLLGSFMAYGCGRSSTGRPGFVPNDGYIGPGPAAIGAARLKQRYGERICV
jgi:hypothetical protein